MTTTPAVREPGPGSFVTRPPIRGALLPPGPDGRHRTSRRVAAAPAADGGKACTR
ncbi:hypothetical protein [Streptomyces albidochromogenes]|uniref:Uncharacterized protein n=1 Tax=Streptomyces albidochromogenes TaxID=329524 RepID=A0ABW6FM08_9ACTN